MSTRRNQKGRHQVQPKHQRTPQPIPPQSSRQIATGMLMILVGIMFLGVHAQIVKASKGRRREKGQDHPSRAQAQTQADHEIRGRQRRRRKTQFVVIHDHDYHEGLAYQQDGRKKGH